MSKMMKALEDRVSVLVDDAAERLHRDQAAAKHVKITYVWLRWEFDSKTKQRTTILGVHGSMRSAMLALPDDFQKLTRKYPADSPYVLNYINRVIERRSVEE